MPATPPDTEQLEVKLTTMLIRDLVEEHPEVMPILMQRGMDVCCGGGMTVPDAALAHQEDSVAIISEMLRTIRGEGM
jgi:iron-sulfur cluster repair protein YtfE (RIC family)